VGGGPIGSITGSLIARDGFKVLIVEKQAHPRWKPCGEGISVRGIQLLKQFDLYKPVQNILWGITGVSINILHENVAIKRYDKTVAYTLNRATFDHALFKYAQELGAETHETEEVVDITSLNRSEISVKTTQTDYTSQIIIGADGIYSLVGRKLFRQWKKDEVALCQVARYRISKKHHVFHPATMEYYFIEGGYGWVFPRVENEYLTLNIGIGKLGEIKSSLNALFNNFVESLENEKRAKLKGKEVDGKVWTHLIPTRGPSRKTYSDRCLLVGDAGGFVNPLTGAGLHYGILSGIYAAETAIQFLTNKIDSLEIYEDKWSEDFKPIFSKAFEVCEKLYSISPMQLLEEIQRHPEVKEKLFQSFIVGSNKQ
jgi:geranylgeranyl reductase family protein